MQNGITINGVEYELFETEQDDCETSCDIYEYCKGEDFVCCLFTPVLKNSLAVFKKRI